MSISGVVEHEHEPGNDVPKPVQIMHFTHISNIENVVRQAGLLSHAKAELVCQADIADQLVQNKRAQTQVRISPGGSLHEYVPFYFAELSPMLYRLSYDYGRIPEVRYQPLEYVYLVSTARQVHQLGLPYVFTNGHPLGRFSEFFHHPDDIHQIDWALMRSVFWNNTENDLSRRTRREAEFLVQHHFPYELISFFVVHNSAVAQKLEALIASNPKPIYINPRWFYRKLANGQIKIDSSGVRR
jgi:ssDNA thymidine ADP-ribosyltransferase, DarT